LIPSDSSRRLLFSARPTQSRAVSGQGDTIETAIPIPTIPGTYTGTTVGYNNNYDEACPYGGSTAPEVVLQVTPTEVMTVDIDLCYSSYDTKLYVYDEFLNLIACNDDFHPQQHRHGDP
jgi:hypothetical protein